MEINWYLTLKVVVRTQPGECRVWNVYSVSGKALPWWLSLPLNTKVTQYSSLLRVRIRMNKGVGLARGRPERVCSKGFRLVFQCEQQWPLRGPGLPWAGKEQPSCLWGAGRTWPPPDGKSGPPAPGHGLGPGIHSSVHLEDLLTRLWSGSTGQKPASHLHLLSSMVLALSLWGTFFFKDSFS